MPWIPLLLAVAALGIALTTSSVALMVASLLAALGFVLAWAMQLHVRRVAARRPDPRRRAPALPGDDATP